ncbi:MAG TPA: flagellar hook-associated protein 3, partial [Planctomycetes bacterium]|nr:flagellar hook-associated protein 3 [Planctomycetota bacterium]
MSLRVTRSMLFRSTLWNIQRNSRRLADLQEMLGSGRKINRPSDDPAGILRMLPLKV